MIENAVTLVEIKYANKVIPIGSFIRIDKENGIALWQDDYVDVFSTEYRIIYFH